MSFEILRPEDLAAKSLTSIRVANPTFSGVAALCRFDA
jgi:hypothetical protein